MKHLKIIPWLLFPVFIASVVLLRDGTLLEWQIDFNIVHNLCGISALTHVGMDVTELIVTSLAFKIGVLFLLLTLILGPFFCGYICPFGVYQRLVYLIGGSLNVNRTLPLKVHNILKWTKYFVMVFFIYLVVYGQVMFYINLDPYHAFVRVFFGGLSLIGTVYLVFITLASLIVKRPFCNYLCPYGASFNVLSIFRVMKVTRSEYHCIDCKKCDQTCPVQINISNPLYVKDMACIGCHDCIRSCPRKKALKLQSKTRNYVFFFVAAIALIILILFYPEKKATTFVTTDVPLEIISDLQNDINEEKINVITEPISLYIERDYSDIREATQSDIDVFLDLKEKKAELERLIAEEIAKREAEALAKAAAKAKADADAKAAAEAKALSDALAASQSLYNDGIYSAKVNAYRADMVVQIELKNDVIISVEILEHKETMSYYNFSASKMIYRIIEANSPDVEIVSGATRTSLGIKNGVRTCLNKAKK